MSHEDDAALDGRLLHRLVFFTDAVFAIVLTLLVLELRPPESHGGSGGAEAFAEMGPHFLAFFMSFALIGIFWAAHMSTTRRLVQFDWPVAVMNLVFLFPICLIPFASAWFGQGPGDPFVWSVYCGVLVATSVANIALVLTISRGRGRLIAGGLSGRDLVYRLMRASAPGVAFAIGLALLHTEQAQLSYYCWVLIPVALAAARFVKPRAAKSAPAQTPG